MKQYMMFCGASLMLLGIFVTQESSSIQSSSRHLLTTAAPPDFRSEGGRGGGRRRGGRGGGGGRGRGRGGSTWPVSVNAKAGGGDRSYRQPGGPGQFDVDPLNEGRASADDFRYDEVEQSERIDLAEILQRWDRYTNGASASSSPAKDDNDRVVSHAACGTKMVGYLSLLTGLTFSVLTLTGHVPLTCLTFIILIGVCITLGLATQVLGNKIGVAAAARFTLVVCTGAAITYSLYHAANDGISAHHADLLHVLEANTMAMGAFLGIFVVFFVGTKLLGSSVFKGGVKVWSTVKDLHHSESYSL